MNLKYPLVVKRRKTRVVSVGKVKIGGNNPIRIQSMLTNFTRDVTACVKEIRSLANVGCEIIRITVPNRRDLECVPEIRRRMKEEGIDVPLVADIHFAPHLAIDACELFDKVRINPGNFSDRPKNSSSRSYEHFDLEEGFQRMEERLKPLIGKLKRYRKSLRIGVNQGSLSARMIEHFGDTPLGMVESALETLRILERHAYFQCIVSLKSSNPLVVQRANRLLAQRLPFNSVPFHLGVTEAGNDVIGRVKGLSGIGALLADGIGDTVRFSLTEASVNEIDFAKRFLKYYDSLRIASEIDGAEVKNGEDYEIGLTQVRRRHEKATTGDLTFGDSAFAKVGYVNRPPAGSEAFDWDFEAEKKKNALHVGRLRVRLIDNTADLLENPPQADELLGFSLAIPQIEIRKALRENLHLNRPCGAVIPQVFQSDDYAPEIRIAQWVDEGMLDFVLAPENLSGTAFARLALILQATRVKMSETDYVACPSCGRTLFNLERITAKIKRRTKHLKGVKIGIMGCIVNGPGEMADADFGYVGSATGKVDLYLGQDRVKKNIVEEEAVDELIKLIRDNGKWTDPPSESVNAEVTEVAFAEES